MAVTNRLSRLGRKKQPFYRIVVADKINPRDGRFIERIGTVNPLTNPATVVLKEDRVKHWIGVGAKTSDTVSQIIEKIIPGYLKGVEEGRLAKIRSKRAARKARIKAADKGSKKSSKSAKSSKTK